MTDIITQGAGLLGGLGTPMFFVGVLAVVLTIMGVLFLAYKSGRLAVNWDYNVFVYEMRAGQLVPAKKPFDRARIVTKEGQQFLLLFKRGKLLKPPNFEFITANNWIILISPNNEEFHPCRVEAGKVQYRKANGEMVQLDSLDINPVMDESLKFVFAEQQTRNAIKFHKPDFLEKYFPICVLMVN